MRFAFENLEVWSKAVDFAVEVIDMVENIASDRKHYRYSKIEISGKEVVSMLKGLINSISVP